MRGVRIVLVLAAATALVAAQGRAPDWPAVDAETMRHFQAIVQIDSANPPGNETRVAEYVKRVLDDAGVSTVLAAEDPGRANVIARIKSRAVNPGRPILMLGHSDTMKVHPAKWTYPPFSATRAGGYVYGRGTIDDK